MITIREPDIRHAIAGHPELTDRQIATRLGMRCWSKVRLVRAAIAAEVNPPPPVSLPVSLLAPDDAAPRQPVIAANPTVVCANCGREGTPAPAQPAWCKPCWAGGADWRATWPSALAAFVPLAPDEANSRKVS